MDPACNSTFGVVTNNRLFSKTVNKFFKAFFIFKNVLIIPIKDDRNVGQVLGRKYNRNKLSVYQFIIVEILPDDRSFPRNAPTNPWLLISPESSLICFSTNYQYKLSPFNSFFHPYIPSLLWSIWIFSFDVLIYIRFYSPRVS